MMGLRLASLKTNDFVTFLVKNLRPKNYNIFLLSGTNQPKSEIRHDNNHDQLDFEAQLQGSRELGASFSYVQLAERLQNDAKQKELQLTSQCNSYISQLFPPAGIAVKLAPSSLGR